MKKSIQAILTASVIMLSFLAVPLIGTVQAASDPTSWYKTVNGVLTTDTYSLYPYNSTSMDVGFSKFGEMIDSNNNVGLQYPGYDSVGTYDQSLGTSRDPFANELVTKVLWVNGWFINIVYRNKIYEIGGSPTLAYRNVWAFALFSDGQKFGGDWNNNMSTPSLNTGGRQTNKIAVTDPMQVLYDGPRRFVALLTTHIYDSEGSISWPLVDVLFTIDFQKDKKEVIVYKEVKLKLETKYLDDLVDIQFSNRGEWDLGPVSGVNKIRSYVDFTQLQYGTPYGNDWSVQKDLQVHRNETWIGPGTMQSINGPQNATGGSWWYGFKLSCPTILNPFVNNTEHVFVNGLYKIPSTPDYVIRKIGTDWWVLFPQQMGATDKTSIAYKNYILGTYPFGGTQAWPSSGGEYAYSLAQLISCDITTGQGTSGAEVGFEAYWPVLSSFTPDGWGQRMQPLENQQQTDMVNEPQIPFLIGQWDFSLNIGEQFRGVSVLGVTNYHNAQDNNLNPPYNGFLVPDDEVQYQLDEVFNPWNLQSAITKKTDRWVDFSPNPIDSYTFVTTQRPAIVVSNSEWDQYNVFSERVEDLTTGKVLNRYKGDYGFIPRGDGYGVFTDLNPDHYYKFLYSTYTDYSSPANITIPLYSGTKMNETQSHLFDPVVNQYIYDPTGVTHHLTSDELEFSFTNKSTTPMTTNIWFNYSSPVVEWESLPFTVFKEDTTYLEAGTNFAPSNVSIGQSTNTLEFNVSMAEFSWAITGPRGPLFTDLEDVYFRNFCADFHVNINVFYNSTDMNYTVYASVTFGPPGLNESPYDLAIHVYDYSLPGRYEWVTVGRDASTVDVAGAIDVAAALKDKRVEIGNSAMDMNGTTYQGQIPFLLSKTTSGKTPDFQNYWLTPDTSTPGQRQALADDWCTRYPVSSSNIITEGGPLANQLTTYFNEYTSAFYAASWFTPATQWQNTIAALPCWSKNAYSNTGGVNGTGYATIGTYLDINGTVGLVIYGLDARDTYYVSKFFYQDIIQELQTFPPGVTSLVIKIDYTDPKHPTFTIPEVLGTISERLVESVKGGLHPDP